MATAINQFISAKETATTGMPSPVWQEIQNCLKTKKDEIYQAIGNYPPPITGCDAQFNHLIEQRGKIAQELSRLDALLAGSLDDQEKIQQHIEGFLRSSDFIDEATAQRIRSSLHL